MIKEIIQENFSGLKMHFYTKGLTESPGQWISKFTPQSGKGQKTETVWVSPDVGLSRKRLQIYYKYIQGTKGNQIQRIKGKYDNNEISNRECK